MPLLDLRLPLCKERRRHPDRVGMPSDRDGRVGHHLGHQLRRRLDREDAGEVARRRPFGTARIGGDDQAAGGDALGQR
ncbi:MAG: hypothetical protein IT338_02480, partial [Thermomicrobiales bacterium]|nr:hypothetical protein [Thermomicrobiales bacterium]